MKKNQPPIQNPVKNEPNSYTAPNIYFPSLLHAIPDEEAVRKYLSLQNSGEIALLAATMAPRHKKFDPVALADSAIELHRAAADQLRARRNEELQRMSPSALLLLKTHLGIAGSLQSNDTDLNMLLDPVKGPLVNHVHVPLRSTEGPEMLLENLKTAMDEAAARSKVSRPEYPFRMITALPFAAGDPDASIEILEKAFKDFLIITTDPSKDEEVQAKYEELVKKFSISADTLIKFAHDSDISDHLNSMASEYAAALKPIRDIEQKRLTHTPGNPVPATWSRLADEDYCSYFPERGLRNHEAMLNLLKSGFYGFWKTHKTTYQSNYEEKNAKQIKAIEKCQTGGKIGVGNREDIKWQSYTKHILQSKVFRTFSNLPRPKMTESTIQKAAESLKIECVNLKLKSKASPPNILLFIKHLITAAINDETVESFRINLPNTGFRGITDETLTTCKQMVRENLGKNI